MNFYKAPEIKEAIDKLLKELCATQDCSRDVACLLPGNSGYFHPGCYRASGSPETGGSLDPTG